MSSCKSILTSLLMVVLAAPLGRAQTAPNGNSDSVLMRTLQQELDRAMTSLAKADPAPYFISNSDNDENGDVIVGSQGAIIDDANRHERSVDISVRVGGRDLDNTHGENRFSAITTAALPLDDKGDAIARVLWLNTDHM